MSTEVSIYALCDPDTGDVRYIGKTRQPITARFGQHLNAEGWTVLKGPWIADLRARGLLPTIRVLDVLPVDSDGALARERYYIALYQQQGADLLNIDGVAGRRKPPCARIRKYGWRRSLVRLPDQAGEELQRVAGEKGLDPAVLVRLWVMERLQEERRRTERDGERRQ